MSTDDFCLAVILPMNLAFYPNFAISEFVKSLVVCWNVCCEASGSEFFGSEEFVIGATIKKDLSYCSLIGPAPPKVVAVPPG